MIEYIILFLDAFFLFVVNKVIPMNTNNIKTTMYRLEDFDTSNSIPPKLFFLFYTC